MRRAKSVISVLILGAGLAVSGCASQYASLDECERAEAAYRGGVIGFVTGAALSDNGRRVVRDGGRTVVKTSNSANVGALALGTLAGRGAGVLYHEATSSGRPNDVRPYEGDWLGRCKPLR